MNGVEANVDDINVKDNICIICRKICKCTGNTCICPWFNSSDAGYSTDSGCCVCKKCYTHYDRSKKILKIILEEQ